MSRLEVHALRGGGKAVMRRSAPSRRRPSILPARLVLCASDHVLGSDIAAAAALMASASSDGSRWVSARVSTCRARRSTRMLGMSIFTGHTS